MSYLSWDTATYLGRRKRRLSANCPICPICPSKKGIKTFSPWLVAGIHKA